MIGYSTNGYRLYDPKTGNVIVERNVFFDETITKNINHEELSDENYLDVEDENGNTTEDETKTDAYDTEDTHEDNPITVKRQRNHQLGTKTIWLETTMELKVLTKKINRIWHFL
ncbi:hypothetical protein WA026_014160 [Henosepilachna vigintioctopunctata]|uniref:Retroviral polymerase SH3-like domain-containing protein n=1 Tax=Henosepilachna vigintioctopunctata TaxID=420089 RepID=A0AAW1TX21_9CUCU